MELICGPNNDRRKVNINLPVTDGIFGVLVSGGIDSAILYYLLCYLNQSTGTGMKIMPLTVTRREGSRYFARMVIDYIHTQLGIPKMPPGVVGDPTLNDDQQVRSGVLQAVFEYNVKPIYVGLIQALPEHMIGWQPIVAQEDQYFKTPFKDLNKSHVIDIVHQFGQEFLFKITHSCAELELGRCGVCNGCRERQWGFDQLGRSDPGNI